MSFKFFVSFIFYLFLFGCGVKAAPKKPPETAIKSYIDSMTSPPEINIPTVQPTSPVTPKND